jgi:hypothetical protein
VAEDRREIDAWALVFVAIILAIPVVLLTLGGAYGLAGFAALFAWWLLRKPPRYTSPWWIYASFAVIALYWSLIIADAIATPAKPVNLAILAIQLALAVTQMQHKLRKPLDY